MEEIFPDNSPMDKITAQSFGHGQNDNLSHERWKGVMDCKSKFLSHQLADPHTNIYMNPDVADSWIRCRDSGLDFKTQIINQRVDLDYDHNEEIMEENYLLIDSVKVTYDNLKLKDLVVASRYALYLFAKNNILLLHEGDPIASDNSMVGTIWSEETVGTCAHILSKLQKRPFHLMGPEHYCEFLNNSNSSAAPVLDANGEVIATLVLSEHLQEAPAHDDSLRLSGHTMGLITAMAAAVENRVKLRRSYEELKAAHLRQKVTLAFIDEGIVTIDKTGKIVHANKEATRIFQRPAEEIEHRNISEFLTQQSQLMVLVRKGESVDIEESIYIDDEEHPYVVNIRPVLELAPDQNANSKNKGGAVLRFNSAEKVNAMVTSRTGATATFGFEDIVGESKEFKKAVSLGKRFASSPENVLLIGESGTGKELFAQSIHNNYRPNGPFIAINCAAMPRNLIESEMFGYEAGSFTGAERSGRPGKIELAHGGTLFLDEIGDMPFELQAVLLRVLEDKQVMRVGGRRYKKVDFRLIAATNRDLLQMTQEKMFREDLYFRLSVLSINLPPLRERGNDAELLSQFFINSYCKRVGLRVPGFSPAVMTRIREYKWPGNVRQLENAVVYAMNSAQGEMIQPDDLPAIVLGGNPAVRTAAAAVEVSSVHTLEAMEKVVIENALYKTRNNITKASELLGIGKSTLYRKLKEYDIILDD